MEALIVISFVVAVTAACVKFKVFGTPKETRW